MTTIRSLLAVNTNIIASADFAKNIEGAQPFILEHNGQHVPCLRIPACASPPQVDGDAVHGLPDPEDGVVFLVSAIVFSKASTHRKDLAQYDNTKSVKNEAPATGVAYQTALKFAQ